MCFLMFLLKKSRYVVHVEVNLNPFLKKSSCETILVSGKKSGNSSSVGSVLISARCLISIIDIELSRWLCEFFYVLIVGAGLLSHDFWPADAVEIFF